MELASWEKLRKISAVLLITSMVSLGILYFSVRPLVDLYDAPTDSLETQFTISLYALAIAGTISIVLVFASFLQVYRLGTVESVQISENGEQEGELKKT